MTVKTIYYRTESFLPDTHERMIDKLNSNFVDLDEKVSFDSLIVGSLLSGTPVAQVTIGGDLAVPVWVETDHPAGTGIEINNRDVGSFMLLVPGVDQSGIAGGFGIYDVDDEEYRLTIDENGDVTIFGDLAVVGSLVAPLQYHYESMVVFNTSLGHHHTGSDSTKVLFSDLSLIPSTFPPSSHTLEGHTATVTSGKVLTGTGSNVFGWQDPAPTWGQVTGKPSTFPPEAHNQAASTITADSFAVGNFGFYNTGAHAVLGITAPAGTTYFAGIQFHRVDGTSWNINTTPDNTQLQIAVNSGDTAILITRSGTTVTGIALTGTLTAGNISATPTANYIPKADANGYLNTWLNYGSSSGTVCAGDDSRLSNSRTPTAHQLDSATYHTVSGLTTGHVLQATGATTFGFGAMPAHNQAASTITAGTFQYGTCRIDPTLNIGPVSGDPNEGGQLNLLGAGSYGMCSIDNYAGYLRLFPASTGGMDFWAGNAQRAQITDAGKFVIGSSFTALGLLTLRDADTSATTFNIYNANSDRNIQFGVTGTAHSWGGDKFYIYDATASACRVLIDENGKVGINNAAPSALLHISDQNNAGWRYEQYNDGDGNNYRNYRARGTIASPSAVLSGDRLACFLGAGRGATTWSAPNGGISIWAAENFTDSACGTYVTIGTAATGTNPAGGGVERMRIDSAGNVGIGTTSPAKRLEVLDASAAQLRLTHTAATDYADFTVDTDGKLTIAPSGAKASVTAHTSFPSIRITAGAGKTYEAGSIYSDSNFGFLFRPVASGALAAFAIKSYDDTKNLFYVQDTGNVGINTAAPSKRLEVIDATTQLRLSHETTPASDYCDFSVNTAGALSVTNSGSYSYWSFANSAETCLYIRNPSMTNGQTCQLRLGTLTEANKELIFNYIYGTTTSSLTVSHFGDSYGLTLLKGGLVGINCTPAKRLEVLDASAAQLRLTHTTTTYITDFQTTANGGLIVSPTGLYMTLAGSLYPDVVTSREVGSDSLPFGHGHFNAIYTNYNETVKSSIIADSSGCAEFQSTRTTAGPKVRMHFNTTGTVNEYLEIFRNNYDGGYTNLQARKGISFTDNSCTIYLAATRCGGDWGSKLYLGKLTTCEDYTSAPLDKFVFDATNGTLGIGTGTTSGARRLEVKGDSPQMRFTHTNNGYLDIGCTSDNAFLIDNPNGTSAYLYLQQSGDVISSLSVSASALYVGGGNSLPIYFRVGWDNKLIMDTGGKFYPVVNSSQHLGDSSYRWNCIYGTTLDISANMTVASNGTISSSGSKNTYNGMIECWYGANDRYGLGQFTGGVTALYTSDAYAPSSIQFGRMTSASAFTPLMTIDHAGNVGIGTTSPAASLDIYKSYSAGTDSLRFSFNDGTPYWMGIQTYVVGGGNVGYKFRTTNGATTVDAMAITGAGLVGIGVTSPVVRLNISNGTSQTYPTLGTATGNLFLGGDNNWYGLFSGSVSNDGNSWIQVMRRDSATAYHLILQPAGGNVGIGTTSPVCKIDVTGGAIFGARSVTPGAQNGLVLFSTAKATPGSGASGSFWICSDDASNQLQSSFNQVCSATANERRLSIGCVEQGVAYRNVTFCESGGNVGIGVAIPGSNLHIKAGSSTYVALRMENTNGGADAKLFDILNNGNNLTFRLLNDAAGAANSIIDVERSGYTVSNIKFFNGSSTEVMRLTATGLGINLTPGYPLDVTGSENYTTRFANTGTRKNVQLNTLACSDTVTGYTYGIATQNTNNTTNNMFCITNLNSASAANAWIEFRNIDHTYDGAINLCTRTGQSNYTSRLTVMASGYVAIGQAYTTGYRRLDVYDTTTQFRLTYTANSKYVDFTCQSNGSLYIKPYDGYYVQVEGQIYPDAANTREVGSDSLYWAHGHFYDLYSHDAGVHTNSDRRLKTNIVRITGALDVVKQFNPVQFSWINPKLHKGNNGGFIADEIEKLFPAWVEEGEAVDEDKQLVDADGKIKALSLPAEFSAYLVAAIQEMDAENTQLRNRMTQMELTIQSLAAKLQLLEN